MIGLGGPFWYRMANDMSNLSQLLKFSTQPKLPDQQVGVVQGNPNPILQNISEKEYLPKNVIAAFLLDARTKE